MTGMPALTYAAGRELIAQFLAATGLGPGRSARLVPTRANGQPAFGLYIRDPGAGQAARLVRRGFWLEYASMAWMTAEAAVAIAVGIAVGSIALIGFGLDSVIEFAAAVIVVWQLRGHGRQARAIRLIGMTFFVLAVYLAVESIRDLAGHARPGHSVPGLAVAAAALAVMPLLAVAKRRTGQALGNRTLIADSAETAFCAFTSAATLLGTGLNAWLGWWWADPAAALVIAFLAVKEGFETWEDDDGEEAEETAPDRG
jgi:divalent metal cation (Fe/Co/Zn/Cd) transporter